jgi:DNA-directed RNA polymerase subunit RPC12/RpoP
MERHRFIICEECGRKYRVDTSKIVGVAAGFNCRSCGQRILVARPRPAEGGAAADIVAQRRAPDEAPDPRVSHTPAAGVPPARAAGGQGIGLRVKALLLLFLLPAGITAAAGLFFWDQVEGLVATPHREAVLTLLMMLGGLIVAGLGIGLLFGMRLARRVR